MADEYYPIPAEPQYREQIRKLQNSDPASADGTFNPLISMLIENTATVKKQADAAQQTLAQTSVPSRTVEVSAENLRAYIVGLPRLLTENLTIEVFSGKTANNGVVFQKFYGPGSLTVTAKETGTVICNYALRIENCNIPITINGFDIRSSGGIGTVTDANTSISVELNKCSIDGAGYSGQTGIAANNAVISIANSVVKNFAAGVSTYFGGVITLSDCTGAGNSIGISAQMGGIVSLYNSTDDMMGGISYRRRGGIIVKYDGTIIQ